MSQRRFSDAQLDAIRARNPVSDRAAEWVALRPSRSGGRKGFTHVGPCPICSPRSLAKDDGRFVAGPDTWACAACATGGDIIALVMALEGCDFVQAVQSLGGDQEVGVTPAMAERAGGRAAREGRAVDQWPADYDREELRVAWREGWAKGKRRIEQAAQYRERERRRLYDNFWQRAVPIPGTPVEAYLAYRRLILPPQARLRYLDDVPYFADGREVEPVVLHRGPAMLAPVLGADGRFAGLHFTWLDPAFCDPASIVAGAGSLSNKGKALIRDQETGGLLPAKKSRGHKQGGFIDLGGIPDAAGGFVRMIAGEGIETVAAVHTAYHRMGRAMAGTLWRCGIDLGNLAGAATETVRHPILKDAAGRARRVPGDEPDLSSEAMPVPASIEELILLGDGDSDPFTTRNALARAAKRHGAPKDNGAPAGAADSPSSRRVLVRFAPTGLDFDDMLKDGNDRQSRSQRRRHCRSDRARRPAGPGPHFGGGPQWGGVRGCAMGGLR